MKLPRWVHRVLAFFFGYFWLPCPLCGEMFGGPEWEWDKPNSDIMTSWGQGQGVCPNCHKAARKYNDKWMAEHSDYCSCCGGKHEDHHPCCVFWRDMSIGGSHALRLNKETPNAT